MTTSASRHDDIVRRARRRHQQGHRPLHEAAPPSGMAEICAVFDAETPKKLEPASDRRQLRHPQASQGQGVVGNNILASNALHSDIRLLAQPGRTLLRPDHQRSNPLRRVQERRRTRNSHSGIPRAPQCRSTTLRMDRFRHRHTRKSRSWATGVRVGTLGRSLRGAVQCLNSMS